MKVNKFKIESWDDLDKSKYIAGIDPISENEVKVFKLIFDEKFNDNVNAYQQFTSRELEEFLEALTNNKTDDRGDI